MLSLFNLSYKLNDYKLILINIAVISIVAAVLLILNYFIRQKSNKMTIDQNKLAAYECGFEPFSEMHAHSVDVQFFLVSIMFLIFDIELALMFPWAIHLDFLGIFSFWIMIIFLTILTIGFAYEWQKGALNWYQAPALQKDTISKPAATLGLTTILSEDTWETIINSIPPNVNSLLYYTKWLSVEIFLVIMLIALIFSTLYWLKITGLQSHKALGAHVSHYLSIVLVIAGLMYLFLTPHDTKILFNGYFITSKYTMIVKAFIVFASAIILQIAKHFVYKSKTLVWEFPIFIGLATLFMLLLTSAYNLISLFLSLEGLSLCLYILAAYEFNRKSSSEAAIKYFTMGAMSAGCLLFGIACIYGVIGSTSFIDMSYWLQLTEHNNSFVFGIGSLFILYGLLFKAGAWPLHQWVPDVYEGAPSVVTAFFATVVKFTIITLIIHLIPHLDIWSPLLLLPALLSLIVGVLGALESNKIKRFLAYTAINQVGLLLIGIYVNAIDAVLFYLFCYVLTTIAFFILFNATVNMNENSTSEMIFISDLNNFAYYNPIEKVYMIIILFAMAGLPPFVTAIGKWLILLKIAQLDYYALFFIIVLITVFSIYYYVRLVRSLFFEVELHKANKQAFVYIDATSRYNLIVLIGILLFLSLGSFVLIFDFEKYWTVFVEMFNEL